MKYLKFTLLLFFMNMQIIAQINSALITYKKSHIKRLQAPNKSEKLSENQLKRFAALESKSNSIANKIDFKLYYKDNKVIFEADEFMGTPDQKRFAKMALLPFGNGVYYNSKKEKLHQINSFGENFIIKYPTDYTKWQITKESKKIGKYTAFKAIAKEKYGKDNQFTYTITAWFTPEVNISYGPIGYSGLPGLILELTKKNITYYVSKIELNPENKFDIKKPSKGSLISNDEFRKMASGAMEKYRKIRG